MLHPFLVGRPDWGEGHWCIARAGGAYSNRGPYRVLLFSQNVDSKQYLYALCRCRAFTPYSSSTGRESPYVWDTWPPRQNWCLLIGLPPHSFLVQWYCETLSMLGCQKISMLQPLAVRLWGCGSLVRFPSRQRSYKVPALWRALELKRVAVHLSHWGQESWQVWTPNEWCGCAWMIWLGGVSFRNACLPMPVLA